MPGSLSGSTVTVSPSSTTTYTVTGTASGCTGTATQTINVNALPVVTASSSSPAICIGSSVTLDASGATSYNWMPGSLSGASVSDAPTTTTTYSVTGTDANGCVNSATVAVTVNPLPTVAASSSSSVICAESSVTLNATGATSYNWQPINMTGATVTDVPNGSITYTVTGTDANGCSNSATVSVNVNPLPTISISGNSVICLGDAVTLTGNGGTTYSWQPGGQTTSSITDSPVTTTTYSLTGTDANGCSSTATQTVTVGTPPSTPSITVNGNVLTSTVSGASYQWYLNGNPINGATSQSYTATQTGSYTVEVFDANGCGSGQSSAVVDPTGIAANTNVASISVTPNPNNGQFTVAFHVNASDNYTIEIHDVLGQIVYSESLSNFSGDYNRQVDLTTFGKGMYTITLRNSTSATVVRTITY
jgi:hypothetical protein